MPRTCTICSHPERDAIDAALLAGEACTQIAARYSTNEQKIGRMALQRHKADHIPAAMAEAHGAAAVASADTLLDQVRDLQRKTLKLLAQAERAGDLRTAVSAIGQARGNLELLAKLLGELQAQPTINLLLAPEWVTVRGVLLVALAPYPEARAAVAAELARIDHADSA